jgi:hypothetical protein
MTDDSRQDLSRFSAHEYEAFRRYKASRRSFATADLPDEEVEAIASSRILVGKIGRREAAAAGLVPAKRLVFVGRDEIARDGAVAGHGHLDALLDEE